MLPFNYNHHHHFVKEEVGLATIEPKAIISSQLRTARAVNSSPFTDRMCSGGSWVKILKDVVRSVPARHNDGQAPPCKFVDQGEYPQRPAILRRVQDEVVQPDMLGSLWWQTDARSIFDPKPPLRLFLQPFRPRDQIR